MPTKVKRAAAAVAGKNGYSLISHEKFRQLYASLLKYKLIDDYLSSRSAKSYQGAHGLEASVVGVTLDLQAGDKVFLAPGRLDTTRLKDVPLRNVLSDFEAKDAPKSTDKSAPSKGRKRGSSISAAKINAERLAAATGEAVANKLTKNGKIVVVFLDGDAETFEACREAFEFASAQKLPILYVVEASARATQDDHLAEQSALFPMITVDAHDVVAIYRVAQESTVRVREGGGPAMIACMPYVLQGPPVDPVAGLEFYLSGKGLFRDAWRLSVLEGFDRELELACLPLSDPLA
jgi:TPP-dependent pyruvate/acetoin dehydrogenase alpha subunit